MALLFVLYFFSSYALSRRRFIAILFSKSSLIFFSLFVLLIYCNMEWHYFVFEKSNSLYKSLLYFDFFNFVLILFIILLVVLLLCLIAYYLYIQVKTIDVLPLFITTKAKLVSFIISISISLKKLKKFFNAKVLQPALPDHYKIVEYSLIIQFILVGSITLSSCNEKNTNKKISILSLLIYESVSEPVSDDLRQTNTATESKCRATLHFLGKILLQDFSTPSGILLFIISTLTFISILFLFLYYEIYFLMNILSIVLIF